MKSMTGFGRAAATLSDGTEATVVVKATTVPMETAEPTHVWPANQ